MLDQLSDAIASSNLRVDCDSPTVASVLVATLDVLEKSGVPYVVLHGYEDFPEITGSDVDICIDGSVSDRWVSKLLEDNARTIGARVISCHNGAILLTGETSQHRPFFLKLDLDHDYALNGMRIVSGRHVLAARQRHGAFHVPSPAHQLAGYLATSIIKAKLDIARTERLSRLYQSDPVGAAREIARLWPDAEKALLLRALAENHWDDVVAVASQLRDDLITRLRQKDRRGQLAHAVRKLADRLGRIVRPSGLSVVVLGPDGAGKSSVTDAVGGYDLLPIFDRSVCWGFAPPLHRLIRPNQGASSQPHALPARSLVGSLIKAGYWLVFSFLSHPRTHLIKARNGLVLYDRHFVDILVDAKRYRYNGPAWVLRAIWSVIPKPDLIVFLNAPAETIYKRKRELPVEEIARQLADYRKIVAALPNGAILDTNRPLADVVDALNRLILVRYLNRATAPD